MLGVYPAKIVYECLKNGEHSRFSSDGENHICHAVYIPMVFNKYGSIIDTPPPKPIVVYYTCLECGTRYYSSTWSGQTTFHYKDK